MCYIIYKTTNKVNGKIYVGQHCTSANDGYFGSGILIQKAIKKYGKENFIRETLEHCTSANVDEREIFWIDNLSAINQENGYNIHLGGTGASSGENNHMYGNHMFTGQNHPMYGKHHSEETKLKIKESTLGRTVSNETRNKMIINHANNSGKNHPMFGKKHSNETRNKMIINHANIYGKNNPRNKYIFTLSDGRDYWKDLTEIQRATVCNYFRKKQTNQIIYKGIVIERKEK